MSAFIISPETMQRVVHACDKFRVFPVVNGCESLDEIGNRLFALNNAAIAARYGAPEELETFRYRPLGQVPLVHMLKAAECLAYQCSEGNVPEHDDFKALERLLDLLRQEIIQAMPAYQAAPWDSGWPAPAQLMRPI